MRHPRFFAVAFVLAGLATAQLSSFADADEQASKEMLGKKIANVALRSADGKETRLHDLKDRKAVVVVFLSFECPVSTSYSPILAEMAKDLEKQKVTFIGLTTNSDETPAELAKHVKDFNLPFPVYLDKGLLAVNALKAQVTPEVFVLDGEFMLRYRGRIDNNFAARLKKNLQVTEHDLRQALGELLSGRPILTPATVAIGCPIPRTEVALPKVGEVTFYRDVLPVLQKNCQQCHRPGDVGPFSLMTYRQAVNWAADIKEFTQSRRMPPWKPVDGVPFHNERKLTERELATLTAWVDGGTPQGDPKDAPPAREFAQGWQLGPPDMILTVPEDFQVGPAGMDLFRCFVLPTNLKEDKHVVAVECRPGNPRIVHHTLLFIDTRGAGRKMEAREAKQPTKPAHQGDILDKGPGYSTSMGIGFFPEGSLGGWAPGQLAHQVPEGTGMFLPKGSDVVMQVHYHRNGRLEKDRTQIGLYFAKKEVKQEYQGEFVMGGFLFIPAGNQKFQVKGRKWVAEDCTLDSVMAHMHLLGKDIKFTMTPPGGKSQVLLHIKDWDYNWQETYYLKQPLQLKTGTLLEVEAYFDNSAGNPNNPADPPRNVVFGEQTTDEMCFIFLGGTSNRRGREMPLSSTEPKKKAASD